MLLNELPLEVDGLTRERMSQATANPKSVGPQPDGVLQGADHEVRATATCGCGHVAIQDFDKANPAVAKQHLLCSRELAKLMLANGQERVLICGVLAILALAHAHVTHAIALSEYATTSQCSTWESDGLERSQPEI